MPGDILGPARQRLVARLRALRRRRLAVEALRAALAALTAVVAGGVLWVVAEALLYLAPPWRLGLGAAVVLAAAALAAGCLWRPLRRDRSLHRVALDVEARVPELAQRLITALELGDPAAGRGRLHSAELLGAAAAEAARLLDGIDSAHLASAAPALRAARPLGLAAAVALAAVLVGGDAGRQALRRCLQPTAVFPRPQRTHVTVVPGDLEVVRGDTATLRIRLSGQVPPTLRVLRREGGDGASGTGAPWTEEEVVLEARGEGGALDSLRHAFAQVRAPFDYRVVAGDGAAGPFRVRVIDPPDVARMRQRFHFPDHSGMADRVEEEGGDIHALAGTRVDFEIVATKPLAVAELVVDDTLRLPAQVVDERAEVTWRLPVRADSAGGRHEYRVHLVDRKGVANRDPIRYAVEVLRDGEPAVEIVIPGQDGDLPESQQVPLTAEATDDFGVSRVDLVFRVDDGPEERLTLARGGGRQLRATHLWDLAPRQLLPEDRVRYHAEAFDNDAVAGPKKGVSRQYTLRFPSLYELFDETAREQEEGLETLGDVARDEVDARESVEQLRREVLRTGELTWEQKQELEATLAAEEARAQAVEELARQMADTAQKLEQGGLSSGELLDKLAEIRQLMAAVTSPELQAALEQLRQALAQPDAEQLAEALRQFAQDQEAFQQRLDRTLALLRQVHAEQRLLAAVAQAADLAERQSQIDAALGRDAPERLAEQESGLARDTDHLQEELTDLGQALEPISPPAAAALQAQAQEMAQQALSGRMRQMEQDLAARRDASARRLGRGLEEDLGRLADRLQQLQGEFTGSQRREMTRQLREAMAGLLDLSQRQEELAAATAAQRGRQLARLAGEQHALAEGLGLVVEQIAQVGQRTLAMDQGLPATLGYALRRMAEAGGHLGQLEEKGAAALQEQAVGYLNEAVQQLRASLDNLSAARMPSAFGEAMEKLMGMSQQQAALNQATQQALQDGGQQGRQGRGRDGLEALPRLAAEQRRIYHALEELEKQLRGQRSLEGRVGQIRKEMEQVMARMQGHQADPRIAQGQQRILQRMLDASRSIHAREFEKRRRSETGQQLPFTGPEWLPVDLGQRPDALREAMRRSLAGDYPPEYRDLIRRYYEAVYEDVHGGGGTQGLP